MKKRFIQALLYLTIITAAHTQVAAANGQVTFVSTAPLSGRISVGTPDGNADTNYLAQLYAGPAGTGEAKLKAVGQPTRFNASGNFNGGVLTIPGITAGQEATLQVRVWKGPSGSSWDTAKIRGESGLLTVVIGGNSVPPSPPNPTNLPYELNQAGLNYISVAALPPAPASDDFADGNDDGWLRYDGLQALGVAPATFEVRDGAYHLHAPAKPGLTSPGNPPRAAAFYPTNDTFRDFEVAVDLVDWDEPSKTNIGLLARARNIGLGKSEGYFFVHQPNLGRVHVSIVRGETGYLLGQAPITLDHSHKYRMVFSGGGVYLIGQVFDLANPGVPLVTVHARDEVFPDGLTGVVCFSGVGDKDADGTVDNYAVKVGDFADPTLSIGPAPALKLAFASQFPVDGQPWGNAVADLNEDGKPDLVAVNNTGRKLSVLLGNGDGTFQPKLDTAVGSSPQYAAVADFNGDQHLDVAVSNGGDKVSVLLGNGDGTFQAKMGTNVVAKGPALIRSADLNHDGHVDLLVRAADVTTSVLLGNGDGTFKDKVDYPWGFWRIADVNGDTHPDLVADPAVGVAIVPGRGDGTFGDPILTPLASGVNGIATADFNGDGKVDLAVSSMAVNAVFIFLGNGDGTFSPHGTVPVPVASYVEAADLSGDGKADLVVRSSPSLVNANGEAWQRVTIFLGSGDGHFDAGTTLRGGGFFGPMSVADLNADGRPDLAISNSVDFWVNVFLNQGPNAGAGNQLQLTWPTTGGGYPASASSLGGQWADVMPPDGTWRFTHGPVNFVDVDRAAAAQFYRLRKAP